MQPQLILKASLKSHSPDVIYEFLKKNVGTLFMLIKKGYAIIYFQDQKKGQIALSKYKIIHLNGSPVELSIYRESDLEKKQMAIKEPQIIRSENQISYPENEQKDQNYKIEKIIKKHQREMVDFIKNYNQLLESAKQKFVKLISQRKEGNDPCQRFYEFLTKRLKGCSRSMMNNFKIINSETKKFQLEREDQINLIPSFQISSLKDSNILSTKFKPTLNYIILEQNTSIKRIVALNEKQFICTYHHNSQRNTEEKIKIYNKDQELELYNLTIKEGAYGIAKMGENILVGTKGGSIAFFNGKNINDDKEVSFKMHKGPIFDIINFPCSYNNNENFKIATLSMDRVVKVWNVSKEIITSEFSTLGFTERGKIQSRHQISSIEAINAETIALSSHENIHLFNIKGPQVKKISDLKTKGKNWKIKRLSENVIVSANQKFISFLDLRSSNSQQRFTFDCSIVSILPLTEWSVFYGNQRGTVGLVDFRMKEAVWSCQKHKRKIYDICKLNDLIVTGDQEGVIIGWSSLL